MKYKVGDKVRIRKDLVPDTRYGEDELFFSSEMKSSCGETATILKDISWKKNGKYALNIFTGFVFNDDMLEDVVPEKFVVGSMVKVIGNKSKDTNKDKYLNTIHEVLENDHSPEYPYKLNDTMPFLFAQEELELVESLIVIPVDQTELSKYKELTTFLFKELKIADDVRYKEVAHFITELRPDLSKLFN